MAEKITNKLVKGLEAPAKGNMITYDTDIKGFGVRVTKTGSKVFIFNYRVKGTGRERRYTIGTYDDWSVAAARKEAQSLKRVRDRGGDPMGELHEERAAPTVKDLTDRYIEEHLPKKRASAHRNDRSMIDADILPGLGKLKVADVEYADIDNLHRKITKRAPIRANRVVSLMSKMFALSIKWKMRTDNAGNPVKGIERNPENKRKRYLSGDELGRLLMALAAHREQDSVNVVRLLLLTGARRGEVLRAKWTHLDLAKGTWTKPGAETKTATEHQVPLSAPARQLLADMKEKATGEYLFPGKDAETPLTDIKNSWASICKAANIEDFRVHDLRHTYASIAASGGSSLLVIGDLLGHTQVSTTQRYAHLFDDTLRQGHREGWVGCHRGRERQRRRRGATAEGRPIMSDPFEAHHIRIIEWSRAQYQRTGNPFFVWQAYDHFRRAGMPIPEWILEYFDKAADRLFALRLGVTDLTTHVKEIPATGDNLAQLVAKALGFRKKGRGTALSKLKKLDAEVSMALRAQQRMNSGETQETSFGETADELGVSDSTVRRAWREHRPERS